MQDLTLRTGRAARLGTLSLVAAAVALGNAGALAGCGTDASSPAPMPVSEGDGAPSSETPAAEAGPNDAGRPRRDGASDGAVEGPIDPKTGCVMLTAPKLRPSLFGAQAVLLEGAAGAHTLALGLSRAAAPSPGTYAAPPFPAGEAGAPVWFMRLTTATGAGAFESTATSGTLELTDVASPLTVEMAGRASKIELHEMTHDRAALVAGGRCFVLADFDIDTRVALGTPCAAATDCGHEKVCDPVTRTCAEPHCGSFSKCPGGSSCRQQVGFSSESLYACYPTCQPFTAGACGSGATCIRRAPDWSGECVRTGTAGSGAACLATQNDTSTGCSIEGQVCGAGICQTTCDRFAPSPGCGAGMRCGVSAWCTLPIGVANVPIGGTCDPGVMMNYPCGDDGQAYRGECVLDTFGGTRTCRKACRPGADDCPSGQLCGAALLGGYVCK